MLLICKALLLLVFELIIEYVFGTMLTKRILKKEAHPLMSLLMGFMGYQAVFQVITLIIIFSTGVLHHLMIIWGIVVGVTVIMSIALEKRSITRQIKSCIQGMKEHRWPFVIALVVVVAFCYYVSINGESNEDARYYIGLMTTSVDTDTMFQYNVYNGYEIESLYLRRALVTFEIQSAVLCKMTGIHPLIIARIFRACQNVILTSATVFLCSKSIFWNGDKNGTEKAFFSVTLFWIIQPTFANTMYTPATFLLYRTYEAKAFAANMIVLLGMYLCVNWMRNKNLRNMYLICLYLWGSMAISTSAFLVTVAECAILIFSVLGMSLMEKKKQERLHASK